MDIIQRPLPQVQQTMYANSPQAKVSSADKENAVPPTKNAEKNKDAIVPQFPGQDNTQKDEYYRVLDSLTSREAKIQADEDHNRQMQVDLSQLAESLTNREIKAQADDKELLESHNMFLRAKSLGKEALDERRRHHGAKQAALQELAAEIREANAEIDEIDKKEELLLRSRQCCLRRAFLKTINAVMYLVCRGVLVGALLLPWLAPETLQQLGIGDGTRMSTSNPSSCPAVEEPCPAPVSVPPVLFRAGPGQGWPNFTMQLVEDAQGCFHADDKQAPEFLHWTLAESERLKMQNADLRGNFQESVALRDERVERLAGTQKRLEEVREAEKRLEAQRAREAKKRQEELEEQREREAAEQKRVQAEERRAREAAERKRAEEEVAAQNKLEEQRIEEAEKQKRAEEEQTMLMAVLMAFMAEEQNRAEVLEHQAAEVFLHFASSEAIDQTRQGSDENEFSGHQLEAKSFEAAEASESTEMNPPRQEVSFRWTAVFMATAAVAKEAVFALQGIIH